MREIILIAAAGENDELGIKSGLPWHLPDDFAHFKNLTTGFPMIMGRKTFETFPKPLPNRRHIIITRDQQYQVNHPACEVAHSLEAALKIAADSEKLFIIGGGEIYKQAIVLGTAIELTRVHGSFTADTYFPKIDPNSWKLVKTTFHPADERHTHAFSYQTYQRIA